MCLPAAQSRTASSAKVINDTSRSFRSSLGFEMAARQWFRLALKLHRDQWTPRTPRMHRRSSP
eukprot:2936665-Karenia_brevis.AAC.1